MSICKICPTTEMDRGKRDCEICQVKGTEAPENILSFLVEVKV